MLLDAEERLSLDRETEIKLQRGDALEDILSHVRRRGGYKMDAVRALVATGMGLAEAKRVVHCAKTWDDTREHDERLWDALEKAVVEMKSDST